MTEDERRKRERDRAMDDIYGRKPLTPRPDKAQFTRDIIRTLRRENDDAALGRAIGRIGR